MTRAVPVSPADSSRRWLQLRLNVAAGGAARIFTGVCALLQVAILVRVLGVDGYGLWVTLLALAGFVAYFDIGVGTTIEAALAEAHARRDDQRLRRVFSSGLLTLGVIGGIYLLGSAIALSLIERTSWAALAPENVRAAQTGALVVLGFASVGVPLNLAPRLAGALQFGRAHAAWAAVGSAAALVAAAAAAQFGWSWLTLVTALSLIPILQNAGLLFMLYRRLDWPLAWAPVLPWPEWRARLRSGLLLSLPQLGQGLLQVVPTLTIAAVGGPAAATAFNLIQRLAAPLTQGQALLLTPLWPTYVEAHARGDTLWLRRMLRLSLAATIAAMALLATLVWGRDVILPWWVGPGITSPAAMFAWMAGLWFGLNLAAQPLYHYLVGVGRWREIGVSSMAGHGCALAALAMAAPMESSPATQLALASAAIALFWIPGLAWAVWRTTRPTPLPSVA